MKKIHFICSTKVVLLSILSVFGIIFSASAQKNRYGMALSGSEGSYTLTDAAKICPLVKGGCAALPADAYTAYAGYQPVQISDNDYAHCTTLKYTFKTYDTHSLSLEVDIPKLTTGPHPFIIWVHGGGWSNGGTTAFVNQSTYLASRGIAGVRITYSVISQGGDFNQGMQELADVFAFVQAHAAEWGLDMTRFGYAAGSAGTPLASLAAMKHNGNGCKLYMGCNGIYDFQHNLAGSFGSGSSPYLVDYPTQASREVISSINYIPDNTANIPAVAVFHGTADFTISYLQSVALCDSVLKKGGRAEKNIYDYYVHAFFNQGSSDKYEDVILKMYAFAKSVFNMPDVTLPPPSEKTWIARFPFTTGENQATPVDVKKGIRVSDIKIGSAITGNFADNALVTSNWSGFYIANHRYVGFEIISNPLYSFKVTQIDLNMKKSTAQAVNGIFNYGKTFPPVTTKGAQKNGIATTSYSVVSLMANATTPAQTDANLCFGIGIATGTSLTEVISFDEITVYGEVIKPTITVPTILADADSIIFNTDKGLSQTQKITVFGELLENTVEISIVGDINAYFSLDQHSATVTELEYGKNIQINFSAQEAGEFTAELKIESDEAIKILPIKAVAVQTSAVNEVFSGKIWTEDNVLHINGKQHSALSIYNLSGQLVLRQEQLPEHFQTKLPGKGVYFLKMDNDVMPVQKIVVQ
ncbi:MAG: T9SS type A sorting domain-containing protein [Paludibacter sp.]|nr:T9SS type A sorting domain-containing protein [Paludibacter sp.]